MNIILNGAPITTDVQSLAELVDQQRLAQLRIATAVNGRFVAETERARTSLQQGDRVEIVSPRQGG